MVTNGWYISNLCLTDEVRGFGILPEMARKSGNKLTACHSDRKRESPAKFASSRNLVASLDECCLYIVYCGVHLPLVNHLSSCDHPGPSELYPVNRYFSICTVSQVNAKIYFKELSSFSWKRQINHRIVLLVTTKGLQPLEDLSYQSYCL